MAETGNAAEAEEQKQERVTTQGRKIPEEEKKKEARVRTTF